MSLTYFYALLSVKMAWQMFTIDLSAALFLFRARIQVQVTIHQLVLRRHKPVAVNLHKHSQTQAYFYELSPDILERQNQKTITKCMLVTT